MAPERRSASRVLYRVLIGLYPRPFRDRLGESMEQTFVDLRNEQRGRPAAQRLATLLWLFAEAAVGLLKEHGDAMKGITTNPKLAACVSCLLALPLVLLYTTIVLNIQPIERALKYILTDDGDRPNAFGFAFMIGGLLLLPVAFVLNLIPMVRRIGPKRRRALYPLNVIIGMILLFYLSQTWGELILEEIACRSGVPNCD